MILDGILPSEFKTFVPGVLNLYSLLKFEKIILKVNVLYFCNMKFNINVVQNK